MFTGCCAGSTGGGMKLIRFIILFKAAKVELDKIFHPGSVKAVSINGKKISNDIVFKTSLFFFIYFAIFFVSLLLISIDNKDIVSSATAVIASLSNVGPGLGFLFFKDCFFVLHDCRTTGIFPGTGFVHSFFEQ